MIYQDYSIFSELIDIIGENRIIMVSASEGIGKVNFMLDLALDMALSKETSIDLLLASHREENYILDMLDKKLAYMGYNIPINELPINIIHNTDDFSGDILLMENYPLITFDLEIILYRDDVDEFYENFNTDTLALISKQNKVIATLLLQWNGVSFIEVGRL